LLFGDTLFVMWKMRYAMSDWEPVTLQGPPSSVGVDAQFAGFNLYDLPLSRAAESDWILELRKTDRWAILSDQLGSNDAIRVRAAPGELGTVVEHARELIERTNRRYEEWVLPDQRAELADKQIRKQELEEQLREAQEEAEAIASRWLSE
jgi:hypothetical protein